MRDRGGTSEEALYEDDLGIIITRSRLILKSGRGNLSRKIAYTIAHITSVELITRPPNRALGIILTVLGVLILIGTVVAYSISNDSSITLIAGIVVSLILLFIGIILLIRAKPFYVLTIGSASGKEEVIISRDKDYIQPLIVALNEAIVAVGQSTSSDTW